MDSQTRKPMDRREGWGPSCEHHRELTDRLLGTEELLHDLNATFGRLEERIGWLVRLCGGAVTLAVAVVGVAIPVLLSHTRAARDSEARLAERLRVVESGVTAHLQETPTWRGSIQSRLATLEAHHPPQAAR